MAVFESLSDNLSNMIITVFYAAGKPQKYEITEYCCENASLFAHDLVKLQKTVQFVKQQLDYGHDELASDYLYEVWGVEHEMGNCLYPMYRMCCGYSYKIDHDYKMFLDLRTIVDHWFEVYPKEDILLHSGTVPTV